MSTLLYKNTKFKSKIVEFFRKHEDVLDIVLFGSSIKGKFKPKDIDILVIFKDKKDLDKSYKLKKLLEKEFKLNFEITSKTYNELFNPSFRARDSIVAEGFSIVYSRFLSQGLGYDNLMLFKYSLKGFNKSQRMRFYYSLYGRTSKGMLKSLKAKKFSESIILCPVENSEKMIEFFNSWNMSFDNFPVLIPSRVLE